MNHLIVQCMAGFSQHGGVFAVFFAGGLAGSLTHCLTMCAPAVACQAACAGSCGRRLSSASQWHYHLGRLLAYGAMGFAAALASRQVAAMAFWPALSAAMLVAAGLMFLASALFPAAHKGAAFLSSAPALLRGVAMSFMPCGLLYAALMAAAALANPWVALAAMMSFVLGTLPALLAASGAAAFAARRWAQWMNGVGRFGMACNGLALLAMAAGNVR